jgi:hypothetical protein
MEPKYGTCSTCGRVKSSVMEFCGVCTMQKRYSGCEVSEVRCKTCNKGLQHEIDNFQYCSLLCAEQDGVDKYGKPMVQQSARHNVGKTQVREVDPKFIMGLGEVLTASRERYEEGNWMKETKFSTPYESCMRHLMKFWGGDELDSDTNKHHLLHAATNLMFLYYHLDSGKGVDDRLFKKEKK